MAFTEYLTGISQKMSAKFKVLVLNGPNLNMLGKREPTIYGALSLDKIMIQLSMLAEQRNIELSHFQSNSEENIINSIHQAFDDIDFILINPAAFTHTSIAIRDALLAVNIPFIEVHLSNVHSREEFRQHSYFSDIAQSVICGFGADGYSYALEHANKFLLNK